MRIITGHKKEDKVSIQNLLDQTRLPTINQVVVESILKVMWMFLFVRGESYMKDLLENRSNQSEIITRSKTENKLEVGFPVNSFAYYGQKLWNKFPGDLKKKMSKNKFKMNVKRIIHEKEIL